MVAALCSGVSAQSHRGASKNGGCYDLILSAVNQRRPHGSRPPPVASPFRAISSNTAHSLQWEQLHRIESNTCNVLTGLGIRSEGRYAVGEIADASTEVPQCI
jgi:hypothetical protein